MTQFSADEAGFRSWASSRRPVVRRTAYLMCLDWHLADDLAQDALNRPGRPPGPAEVITRRRCR